MGIWKLVIWGNARAEENPRLLEGANELMVVPVISVPGYRCYFSQVMCNKTA